MPKINVSHSALQNYFGEVRSIYTESVSIAEALVNKTNSFLKFVQSESDEINNQLSQLSQIKETAQATARRYRSLQNEFSMKANECNSIASHQLYYEDSRYYYDLACELETVSEQAGRDADNADLVIKAIESKETELLDFRKLITFSIDELNENIATEKKTGAKIIEEINFNLTNLNKTVQSVGNYLGSAPITMPSGKMVSSAEFSTGGGFAASGTSSQKSEERFEMKYKHYKLKSGVIEFKNLSKRPIYRVDNVYSSQIKQVLYSQMRFLHAGFQKEVMKYIDNIIFFGGKGGFIYDNAGKGKHLRIVSIDASDPAYARNIFLHIGHQLYTANSQKQKTISEKTVVMHAKNSMRHANAKIANLSRKIAGQNLNNNSNARRSGVETADSKFFAECFSAYVNQDTDYLNEIKSVYSESYKEFENFISKY